MAAPKLVDFVLEHFGPASQPTKDLGKAIAKMTSIPDNWPEVVATEVLNWLPVGSWFDATISPDLREKLGIWDEAAFSKAKEALNTLSQAIIDKQTELDNMDRGDDDYLDDRHTLAVASGTASQEQAKTRRAVAASASAKKEKANSASKELQSMQQQYQDMVSQYDKAADDAAKYETHKYKNFIENLN